MKERSIARNLLVFSTIHIMLIKIILSQPDTLWTRTFGGDSTDWGSSCQQTFDGGYIITGRTESYGAGSGDVWLIKTDTLGDIVWTRTFGGSNSDRGNFVLQTSDGGYIIIGYTESFGSGSRDAWLIKTDSSGDTIWTKTFGGSYNDIGNFIQQTFDNGYIITGHTRSYGAGNSDFWLIKTDEYGNLEWDNTYGGSSYEFSFCVKQTTDGGYIITGETSSYGNGLNDVWLVKTDSIGNEEWNQTFGGDNIEWGRSVQQTSDGGYIVTGLTASFGSGDWDLWLIKTDSNGNMEWTQTFGGSSDDWGSSVQEIANNGYIIVGSTYSYGVGENDVWLLKTDDLGNLIWTRTFGGYSNDWSSSLQQTSDGGYIITGGTSSFGTGGTDVWLLRIAQDTSTISIKDNLITYSSSLLLYQNYPNPFNPVTTISYDLPKSTFVNLSIYNVAGNLVETLVNEHKNSGYYSVMWNASGVGSGLYFYRIEAGEYVETKKCLILK